MVREAEDSLQDKDLKRKAKIKESKQKRRRLEKVEGWGQSSIQEEEDHPQDEDEQPARQDWLAEANERVTTTKPLIQANLES